MEDDLRAIAARGASSLWENRLSNFEESYITLGTQLQEDSLEWQIHETIVVLKHWYGIIPEQR